MNTDSIKLLAHLEAASASLTSCALHAPWQLLDAFYLYLVRVLCQRPAGWRRTPPGGVAEPGWPTKLDCQRREPAGAMVSRGRRKRSHASCRLSGHPVALPRPGAPLSSVRVGRAAESPRRARCRRAMPGGRGISPGPGRRSRLGLPFAKPRGAVARRRRFSSQPRPLDKGGDTRFPDSGESPAAASRALYVAEGIPQNMIRRTTRDP